MQLSCTVLHLLTHSLSPFTEQRLHGHVLWNNVRVVLFDSLNQCYAPCHPAPGELTSPEVEKYREVCRLGAQNSLPKPPAMRI